MTKTIGIVLIVIVGLWCVLGAGADLSSQPVTASATRPVASGPASASSREQLEQARNVFRELLAQPTDADRARIAKLIAQLGSNRWKERDEAEAALKKEPLTALRLIREGASGKDPDIASRCKIIASALELQHAKNCLSLRQAIATRQAGGDAAVVGDLIALLDDDNLTVRYFCGNGISRLTGQEFGYQPSAQPEQRRQAAKKAREWWEKNKATFVLNAPVAPEEGIALDLGGEVSMTVVLIPPGTFMMGSPEDETLRSTWESPRHEVTISKPFYMGIYAVTQEQYKQIMEANPSRVRGAQNPVEMVSWDDAVDFCKKVSQKTGKAVHLPTEAQWEYACRAGSNAKFCFGDKDEDLGDYAWYAKNSDNKPHPVGQKKANDFGLCDMHGNVRQWCADWWAADYANAKGMDPQGPESGSNRVARGGCWFDYPQSCRSAYRYREIPDVHSGGVGFRVVLEESQPTTQPSTSPATRPSTQPA